MNAIGGIRCRGRLRRHCDEGSTAEEDATDREASAASWHGEALAPDALSGISVSLDRATVVRGQAAGATRPETPCPTGQPPDHRCARPFRRRSVRRRHPRAQPGRTAAKGWRLARAVLVRRRAPHDRSPARPAPRSRVPRLIHVSSITPGSPGLSLPAPTSCALTAVPSGPSQRGGGTPRPRCSGGCQPMLRVALTKSSWPRSGQSISGNHRFRLRTVLPQVLGHLRRRFIILTTTRRRRLDQLNRWRNAIVH